MDDGTILGIVEKIDDGLEKVETEVSEKIETVETKIETQEYNQQWMSERISTLERNQQELLSKLDDLVIKLSTPKSLDPLEQAEQVIEEVGDDLEKPKQEPTALYPFRIF